MDHQEVLVILAVQASLDSLENLDTPVNVVHPGPREPPVTLVVLETLDKLDNQDLLETLDKSDLLVQTLLYCVENYSYIL